MSDRKQKRPDKELSPPSVKETVSPLDRDPGVPPSPSPHDPLCIAILGDFSGRNNKQLYQAQTIHQRSLIEVTGGHLDTVLAGFEVSLNLWLEDDAEEPIEIPIRELQDFHPDRLYQNVEVFKQLRDLRKRLQNPQTFAEAAKALLPVHADRGRAGSSSSFPDPANTGAPPSVPPRQAILSAVHGIPGERDAMTGTAVVDSLVKQIVAPYVEPKADPYQEEMIAAVDQAIAAHMQFILHHPDFQALESAWLSVDFLFRRIERGARVRVYLMDVTRHELEIDLDQDDVTASGLYKRFCKPAPGDVPWGVILGNYSFTDRVEEIMTLLQIGAVARRAQAPFLAAANETLIGCESFAITPDVEDWHYRLKPEVAKAWSLLRHAHEAEYLALVSPGFLLRAPYGESSKPIESFAFEEMPSVPCHSCYLWGNGAFIKVVQIIQAFIESGWELIPTTDTQLDQMPLHVYQADGETAIKPCAEIQLTEQGGRRMIRQGLIPLWSVKDRDAVRSADFHTLAV